MVFKLQDKDRNICDKNFIPIFHVIFFTEDIPKMLHFHTCCVSNMLFPGINLNPNKQHWLGYIFSEQIVLTVQLISLKCSAVKKKKKENGVWGEVTDEFGIGFP